MENAKLARNVVFELFQDLDTFNLEDYRKFDDGGARMNRLLAFVRDAAQEQGAELQQTDGGIHRYTPSDGNAHLFTTNRDTAKEHDNLSLLGLEHPLIRNVLANTRQLAACERAVTGRSNLVAGTPAVLSVWRIEIHGPGGSFRQAVIPLAVDVNGQRLPASDAMLASMREIQPALGSALNDHVRTEFAVSALPDMLRREVEHRGLLEEDGSLAMQLIAWIELVP